MSEWKMETPKPESAVGANDGDKFTWIYRGDPSTAESRVQCVAKTTLYA